MVTGPKTPSHLDFIDRKEGTSPFVENSQDPVDRNADQTHKVFC